MNHKRIIAILYALGAALFYAINVPCSKLMLDNISPTFLAAFLYLGAGIGVGLMYIPHYIKENSEERLNKKDLPYTVGMILLVIIAPILLMFGVNLSTSANSSLL